MEKENIERLFNLEGPEVPHDMVGVFLEARYEAHLRYTQWRKDRADRLRETVYRFKANIRSANSQYYTKYHTCYMLRYRTRGEKTQKTLAYAKFAKNPDVLSLMALALALRRFGGETAPTRFSPEIGVANRAMDAHPIGKLPQVWRDQIPEIILRQYLPHPADLDPSRVAYIQNYQKFIRRDPETGSRKDPLYTVTSAVKFINLINEAHDLGLDENKRRKLGEAFIAASAPLTLRILRNDEPNDNLEREWVRLYRQIAVDYSCMRDNPNNAVACYAVPDNHLGLAYWEDHEGNLMSRSIVNTETMTFSRVYPSASETVGGLAISEGERLLEAAGFAKDPDITMEGVCLNYQETDDDIIVCPYIDGNDAPSVSKSGRYLVVDMSGGGDYKAQNTSTYGIVEGMDGNRTQCEDCGDRFDAEYEGAYIDSHGSVCDSCLSENWVYAYTSSRGPNRGEEYIRTREAVEYDGEYYLDDSEVLAANGLYRCSQCDDVHEIDDMHNVEDEGMTCEDCCVQLSYTYYEDADYRAALPADTCETHDGETILSCDAVEIDGETYFKDEKITQTAEEWEALLTEAKGSSLGMTNEPIVASAAQLAAMLN